MPIPLSPSTLGSYITSVRMLLRQPNSANSTWSDLELTHYLNEAIRTYFLEVTNNDEGAWTKVVDLDIVSGQETVDLPSDCFEVRSLYKAVSQGYIILPYKNAISDSFSTQGGANTNTYFPAYYFRDNKLVIHPVPNFSETSSLRLEYIYFPETLTGAGDAISDNLMPVFRQVIEMYAVYKAKLSESLVSGVDTSALAEKHLSQLYTQFKNTIQQRSKYPQFIKAHNPEWSW